MAGRNMLKLAGAFILLGVILLAGCTQNNPADNTSTKSFYVKYTGEGVGFGALKNEAITVSEGVLTYTETDPDAGKAIKSFTQNLSDSELEELKTLIFDQNKFFDLPADLSNNKCADAPTEFIEAALEDMTHKSGGYCVENPSFRSIVSKLYDYKSKEI